MRLVTSTTEILDYIAGKVIKLLICDKIPDLDYTTGIMVW
jgi:hypothetical protein